jgi:hypothetical protein
MHGLQPSAMTDIELVHYARLKGVDALDKAWVEELLRRLEKTLDQRA